TSTLTFTTSSSLSPSLSSLFYFFLYCYAHHRALHSFPTRRSSDLGGFAQIRDADTGRMKLKGFASGAAHHWSLRYDSKGKSFQRSEEHTSELQSRFDLVCRLLLEKKKKKKIKKKK